MTPDQLALLADTRLPTAARMIGLAISMGRSEGVELSRDDIRSLLGAHDPDSDDTIRRHLRRLESTGWIDRKAGGRGHADTFRLLEAHECGPNAGIRVGMGAALKDRVGTSAALSEDRVSTGAHSKAPTTSSSVLPPPPPPPLGAPAREFIDESEALVGCRDSLADYLAERVDPVRQLAYAQSVAGIIEGTDEATWMMPNGSHYRDERAKLVAGRLNELRSGDEIGKYFPGPPGDIRNLKSKIRYEVKSIAGAKRDAQRKRRSEGGRDPSESRNETRHQTPDVRVHG